MSANQSRSICRRGIKIASCVVLLLLVWMAVYPSSVRSIVPRPLHGRAYYGAGTDQPATGAIVTAVNLNTSEVLPSEGYPNITVGEEGYYQFDVGQPGPSWKDGSRVKVIINGSGDHKGWTGRAFLTLDPEEPTQQFPPVHLLPPPPAAPAEVSGPTTGQENVSYTFSTVATDPNGYNLSYGWDWDSDSNVEVWTRLRPSGERCIMTHRWDVVGSYRIQVIARNEHEVNSSWSEGHTITIGADTEPPNTYITTGPDGLIHEGTVTFKWGGNDAVTPTRALQYTYMLEGQDPDWTAWTSTTSATYHNLSNGSYAFKVKARDEAHNVDQIPASRSFTVQRDVTSPSVTISQGPHGRIHERGALFFWQGSDDISQADQLVYRYRLGSHSGWSSWTGQTTAEYSGLPNGTYTFTVEVTDTAGNTASAAQTFTVAATVNDTVPPTLTVIAPQDGSTTSGATPVTWEAGDLESNVTISIRYSPDNGTSWQTVATDLTGSSYHWDTTTVDNGHYILKVTATDTAGNRNTTTLSVIIDNHIDGRNDVPAFGIVAVAVAVIATLLIRKKGDAN